MDQSPELLKIFRQIRTGTSWDDCWIWTGGMANGAPTAALPGHMRVRVRPYVRRRVHPGIQQGRLLPGCDERCVHPDHNTAPLARPAPKPKPAKPAVNPHLAALEQAARETYGLGYRRYRLKDHSPAM